MRVQAQIEIARPAAAVWEFIIDPRATCTSWPG